MFKNYFKGIEGIADYPVISLVTFFIFFLVIMAWWMRADKKQLDKMSQMPLDNSNQQNNENIK